MFGRIRSLVVKKLYAVLLDPKTRFQVFVGPFVSAILFFVVLFGSVPAIRYLLKLKPTEVLHGK